LTIEELEQIVTGEDWDLTVESLVFLGGAVCVAPTTFLDGTRWEPHGTDPLGESVVTEDEPAA
jgi:hypothetical protein